eukprot:CAMPEP_0113952368 /NCGR_PEP_ID=MMETSP1339-20121228/90376_1 /TAXON_ID=94617 /ORGANISM="Fibrocapsa japonica" /LENGTH=430 /DNA_ID=CAMNT_0000960969 /DNA_START=342 /DNA_END=1634 /DNA_ORIENTATION=+ /assembly_acc=CAM_ASM_000762
METGTIAKWMVQEGESIAPGDVICQVETDKATVDFEAQEDTVLAKILVPEGTGEVKVGQPIMVTVEDAGDAGAFADFVAEAAAPEPAAASPPAPAPAPAPAAPAPAPAAATPAPAASTPSGGRVFASPLARKMAREAGIDISLVGGSGPNGRIIAADVAGFDPSTVPAAAAAGAAEAAGGAAAAASGPAPAIIFGDSYTDIPVSDEARALAARLANTKQVVPHYYLTVDLNLDNILSVREKLNAFTGSEEGEGLSLHDMIVKAAALTMKQVPSVNASWMDTFVRQYNSVDINILMNTTEGVVAPLVRDYGGRGLGELAAESRLLQELALGGALTADQTQMGTFTVANLGAFGVKSFSPIVQAPQACMLALGTAETRIIPNDDPESDQIYKEATMMTCTLSCDHRVVDGAVGAQWLQAFKSHVQHPLTMLL